MDWLARLQMRRVGIAANLATMAILQAVAVTVGLLLDSMGSSEATCVIVFVLGVLLTAVLTTGPFYSFAAAVLSILSYNYYLVVPRFSFRIQGADVPGTMAAMFVVAVIASCLVTSMRSSARQSAEAQLKAQNEQLRANLLRSVSHDLRTPLTSISGNADMLLDPEAQLADKDRTRLAQNIYDDATWLYGVVENLLTITRLEDEAMALKAEVELVDDVIEEALLHVSGDVRLHEVSFVPANELLLARMDSRMMVQVVVNLVNNAIAYTPEGSHITIRAFRRNDRVAIVVADDGPGISPQDKPHIFEPFFTSNSVAADGRRGIGLGLSLCKSIVEAHGGDLWVEDAQPHGAEFTLTIPMEELPNHEA